MLSHARKHHFINADTPCHSVRVSRASQQHTLHTRGYSSLWISGPRADGTLHGKQMPSKRPSGAVAPQALAGPAGPHGAGADRWALRVAPPGHGWSRALPSSVLPSTRRCYVTLWGHTGLRGRWAAGQNTGRRGDHRRQDSCGDVRLTHGVRGRAWPGLPRRETRPAEGGKAGPKGRQCLNN